VPAGTAEAQHLARRESLSLFELERHRRETPPPRRRESLRCGQDVRTYDGSTQCRMNHATVPTERLLEELVERIVRQRSLLAPSLRKEFDRQWGVEASLGTIATLRDDARKALCREIERMW
jgi:hypothetical protein